MKPEKWTACSHSNIMYYSATFYFRLLLGPSEEPCERSYCMWTVLRCGCHDIFFGAGFMIDISIFHHLDIDTIYLLVPFLTDGFELCRWCDRPHWVLDGANIIESFCWRWSWSSTTLSLTFDSWQCILLDSFLRYVYDYVTTACVLLSVWWGYLASTFNLVFQLFLQHLGYF